MSWSILQCFHREGFRLLNCKILKQQITKQLFFSNVEIRMKTAKRRSVLQIFKPCLFIISTPQDEQVLATFVCIVTYTRVCVHMGSYYLKSTPAIFSRGWTRPGRKSTKATVSPSAWTCRLCGLVSPRSQLTHPPPASPPFFSSSANFPYSHWSITLNECQSFHPAVGSKQSPL